MESRVMCRCYVLMFYVLCTIVSTKCDESKLKDANAFWEAKCDEYYQNSGDIDTEFPHMVSLGFGEKGSVKWVCAGTLISEKHVLTAKQCLRNLAKEDVKWIRLGASNFKTAKPSQIQEFQVVSRTPHPEYRTTKYYNDIAILELNKNVTFNKNVRPICLQSTTEDFSNANIIGTGWGLTNIGQHLSENLKRIELVYFTRDQCQEVYNVTERLSEGIHVNSQLCAAAKYEGKDLCLGDSGAPIQIKNTKHAKAYNQVGIASLGRGCGITTVPGVYTRVSYYLPWIQQVVWPKDN